MLRDDSPYVEFNYNSSTQSYRTAGRWMAFELPAQGHISDYSPIKHRQAFDTCMVAERPDRVADDFIMCVDDMTPQKVRADEKR